MDNYWNGITLTRDWFIMKVDIANVHPYRIQDTDLTTDERIRKLATENSVYSRVLDIQGNFIDEIL